MDQVKFLAPGEPEPQPARRGRKAPGDQPPAAPRTRAPQPRVTDIEVDTRWTSAEAWELELQLAAAIVAGGYQKDIGAWVKIDRVPGSVAKNGTGWKYSIMVGRHDDRPMAVSTIKGMLTRGRKRLIQLAEERGAEDAGEVSRRIHPQAHAKHLTPQRPRG